MNQAGSDDDLGKLSHDGGFTLLEMLVALALLALIMSALSASLFTARKALVGIERSQATHALGAAAQYLRAALYQARPVPPGGASDQKMLSFDGTANSVRFLTTYAPKGQYDGVYVVEITTEPSRSNARLTNLVVHQSPYRPTNDANQAPVAETSSAILVENAVDVVLSYFGKVDADTPEGWVTTWRQADSLPSLVGVDIAFPAVDSRRWRRLDLPINSAGKAASPCPPRMFCR